MSDQSDYNTEVTQVCTHGQLSCTKSPGTLEISMTSQKIIGRNFVPVHMYIHQHYHDYNMNSLYAGNSKPSKISEGLKNINNLRCGQDNYTKLHVLLHTVQIYVK